MTQRGFTLIELLVALAVGSLVIVGALGAIHQVVWGTSRTNSQVVTLNEVNRSALYLKKDLSTYGNVDLTVESPDLIAINWADQTYQGGELPYQYEVTYSLPDTELLRIYTINGTPMPAQIIGRHITYLSFARNEVNDRFIDIVITATEGDMTPRSETLEFSVYQLKEVVPE
ncbi:type II secretion system protein J [Chloroflexota bacterium]